MRGLNGHSALGNLDGAHLLGNRVDQHRGDLKGRFATDTSLLVLTAIDATGPLTCTSKHTTAKRISQE